MSACAGYRIVNGSFRFQFPSLAAQTKSPPMRAGFPSKS